VSNLGEHRVAAAAYPGLAQRRSRWIFCDPHRRVYSLIAFTQLEAILAGVCWALQFSHTVPGAWFVATVASLAAALMVCLMRYYWRG